MLRPKQKISDTEKNEEWIIANAKWANDIVLKNVIDRERINDLYQLVTGQLRTTSYRYLTEAYGKKGKRNYPAKLINYDFITPLISQLVAKFSKTPFRPQIYAKNSEIDNIRNQYELEELVNSLRQQFINYAIESGKYVPGQTDEKGQPIQEPVHPEVIKQQKMSIPDTHAQNGHKLFDYIRQDEKIDMKWRQMFFDFIMTNMFFSCTTVNGKKVEYIRCKPQNLAFFASDAIEMIEEAEVIKYTNAYSLAELVDILKDVEGFDADMIDNLENHPINSPTDSFFTSYQQNALGNYTNAVNNTFSKTYTLSHIQWTAYSERGKLSIPKPDGSSETVYVTRDYIESEGENIEWRWCAEQWEVYVLQGRHIIGGRRVDESLADFDNPNKSLKSYNGRIYMYQTGIRFNSIAERLARYQELYNVLKWKIQYTINKNKDKLMVMPIGLMNGLKHEEDYVMEYDANDGVYNKVKIENGQRSAIAETLYYADTTQFLFVDEKDENFMTALQALKQIDLSLGNHIEYLINYAYRIKNEAAEEIGFNRFNRGEISASDAVSNTQDAMYIGDLVTYEYFKMFNEFQIRETERIISFGKVAFRGGIVEQYITSDGERSNINITPYSIDSVNYGVFAYDSQKEQEKYGKLEQLALTMSQNMQSQAPIAKIIKQDGNIDAIVAEIEIAEEAFYQREQAKLENDRSIAEAQIAAQSKKEQDELDFKYYKQDEDTRVKLELGFAQMLAAGDNETEVNKLRLDALKLISENANKREELRLKGEDIKAKVQISKDKVQVATVNK